MKKNNGQGIPEFVLIIVFTLAVLLGSLFMFGEALSNVFKDKNPAETFNANRTMRYEKPGQLVSNVNITVCGTPVKSPIEKVIKANLLNGSYVQITGSSGRLKEITQIMQEYVVQLNNVVNTMPLTVARTNYLNALAAYQLVLNDALIKIAAAGTDNLKIKMALLGVAVKLNDSGTLATNLKNTSSTYLVALPPSNKKSVIDLFTSDLLNFGKNIEYDVNNGLYNAVLSTNCNNTLAQDENLVSQMWTDYATYTVNEKDNYIKKIDLDSSSNYSTIAPGSYNDVTLCTTLGGAGNPCNI